MENLPNSGLLDENVGANLKMQRLERTAEIAQNPNMERQIPQNIEVHQPKPMIQSNSNPQIQQPMQMQNKIEQKNMEKYTQEEENIPNNLPTRDYSNKATKASDENKILGLKPVVFYSILGAAVLIGGIYAYKKFYKKGKSVKTPDASSVAEKTASAVSGVDIPTV
jgi:hypothetical protein